ncbi:MAG TPA: heavy metal-responsive transcriptional regulator [Blastocatellia bacterium]|nr:heavy metal-responsive transcriptional regulator [Blastocatellia bacterium]
MGSKENEKRSLRSGELARMAGVSPDTLRHYERKGVIHAPRRSPNGYREYEIETLARVRLVRRAVDVGFSLNELAKILKERDQGRAPCLHVRELAAAKLAETVRRIGELEALRRELESILRQWDAQLERTKAGEQARLLEGLTNGAANKAAKSADRPKYVLRPVSLARGKNRSKEGRS